MLTNVSIFFVKLITIFNNIYFRISINNGMECLTSFACIKSYFEKSQYYQHMATLDINIKSFYFWDQSAWLT